MRVLVYGAGAVGSLVGARLASAGFSVTLLARRAHAEAVRRQGLRWIDARGRPWCAQVAAAEDVDRLDGRFDVVFVTVKGYDVERAGTDLPGLLAPRGRAVCLANGVGHEETLSARLGQEAVVAGALTASASLQGPGRVVQHTRGGVGLAAWEGGGTGDLVAALRAGGFRARAYPRPLDLKWSKLLLNLMANATSALLAYPPAEVYADPRLFWLERRMLQEAVAVGRALGVRWVNLPGFAVRVLVRVLQLPESLCRGLLRRAVARGRGQKLPSLWYDLPGGRTEVAYLHGAVARWGAAVGVAAPVNSALTQLVQDVAAGRRPGEAFRGRPDALLREVAGQGPRAVSQDPAVEQGRGP